MVDFHDNGEEAAFREQVQTFITDEFQPRRERMRAEARAAAPFERTSSQQEWEANWPTAAGSRRPGPRSTAARGCR